jgi:thioredoxin 1
MKPIHSTDLSFHEEVANQSKPILVDFWAEWCGPCRTLSPILDELATEFGDQVLFAKMNIDENPKTAQAFNIRSIPTLVFLRNGVVQKRIVGLAPKSNLQQEINDLIMTGATA